MKRTVRTLFVVAATLAVAAAPAPAHHPEADGLDPIQAISAHHQDGGQGGHLPPVQRNVELVGKLDLFGTDERPGRISDVASFGNHAYLGAFYEPDCQETGVHVVDISDPSSPKKTGFIPASPGSYVGEGVQVLDMNTPAFKGQVLIHNNENCAPEAGPLPAGVGGASLWDVSNPAQPKQLKAHVGDMDPTDGAINASMPHQTHSAFGWQQGDKAYMAMVDNVELGWTDIDIFDITDPRNPTLVAETGAADFGAEVTEDPSPNGNSAFVHDMVVKKIPTATGTRYVLLGSYWDGGYIQLDVTNLPQKPVFLSDTDFGDQEPFAAQMGLPADWTPEGNAHQAEFNHDNTMFMGADEDFGPHRVTGLITTGTYSGQSFSATQGSNVPQIDESTAIAGDSDYVGQACTPLPPVPAAETRVAIAERGTCTFTIKTQNIQAAGYDAGIVMNDRATDPDCDAHVNMLAVGDIPFVFVGRSTGLKLLNLPFGDPCATTVDATAANGQGLELKAAFDGWGYLHLYDANTMQPLDHWALPESLDRTKATGSGDLSVHEVAMDPSANRAYASHYSGGFRVFDFSRKNGIQEVGAFIAEGGNNFWGVEVHPQPGSTTPLVLASDRDSGLWIFRYTGGRTKGGGKR